MSADYRVPTVHWHLHEELREAGLSAPGDGRLFLPGRPGEPLLADSDRLAKHIHPAISPVLAYINNDAEKCTYIYRIAESQRTSSNITF